MREIPEAALENVFLKSGNDTAAAGKVIRQPLHIKPPTELGLRKKKHSLKAFIFQLITA